MSGFSRGSRKIGNCARTARASNVRADGTARAGAPAGAAAAEEAGDAGDAGARVAAEPLPAATGAAECAGLRWVTASPDLVADRVPQLLAHALERDAVEHRGEETLDDQTLGPEARQAARHEVVHLLGVHVPDRRAVRAAHVVRQDLEARDAVGARRLGEQQVAVRLVGV